MKTVLKAKNISKTYENIKVLNNISLNLKENESIAIMGASGEGKTTLLHILGNLETPDSGEIFSQKSSISFIFQAYNLLEDLTALENISLPSKIKREKNIEKAIFFLKEVGLFSKKNTLSKKLSGGEKQRIAIARAFSSSPKIILADEPSGNLDKKNSDIVHNMLINFSKKNKNGLIIATHDKNLANLCCKKYLLKEGNLLEI